MQNLSITLENNIESLLKKNMNLDDITKEIKHENLVKLQCFLYFIYSSEKLLNMNDGYNDISLSLSIHESILIMREISKKKKNYGIKSNEILKKYNDKNNIFNDMYNEINHSNNDIKHTRTLDNKLSDNFQFNISLNTSNIANLLIEISNSFIMKLINNNNSITSIVSTGTDNKLIELEKINNYFSMFCIYLSR